MNNTRSADATNRKRQLPSSPNKENRTELSWDQARAKLEHILEEFISNPTNEIDCAPSAVHYKARWLYYDLDVYCGSILASLALLVLSICSFLGLFSHEESAPINIYRGQLASSIIFFSTSLLSAIVMRKRRCRQNGDMAAKRRAVMTYLKKRKEILEGDASSLMRKDVSQHAIVEDGVLKTRTSLTDIYPVYRDGAWHNVPALLLVEGDHVALQIGDVAPSDCVPLFSSGAVISRGQRIQAAATTTAVHQQNSPPLLPLGKSTLPPKSPALLKLANSMEIYLVRTSPVRAHLRRQPPLTRSPQVHRQLQDIRRVAFLFSVVVLVVGFAVLLARPNIVSRTDLSLTLYVPILAAMGTLPVLAPLFLVSLEVLGTCRILTGIHPYAVDINDTYCLFWRYLIATAASRFPLNSTAIQKVSSWCCCFCYLSENTNTELIPIPAPSMCLLEKLGVATAFSLVDDELACEPHSSPQQLLIPSGNGLKLLDLCPVFEDEDSSCDDRGGGKSMESSNHSQGGGGDYDSDSDQDEQQHNSSSLALKRSFLRRRRRRNNVVADGGILTEGQKDDDDDDDEVLQFEDPKWWQHLPSLKCIGLGALLVDDGYNHDNSNGAEGLSNEIQLSEEEKLIKHICVERKRKQLRSLATCIGFTTEPNTLGMKGDLSPFHELMRIEVVTAKLLKGRLEIDSHALALEDSRNWGSLRTDSTSVIVKDTRSGAYQLLTVGDPRVVITLCQEAWQGESSTILPLNATDRTSILDTSNDWILSDLDVRAFSYTPLPCTTEPIVEPIEGGRQKKFLFENSISARDGMSEEWPLINKQIFLGVLGASITPRKEIEKLLIVFGEAGVRFVYFSPRNMRRTKEVASQMGIDVAWNCAISLRPLDDGEAHDAHRMVSNYADWDVNAKLPHGIEDVRKHLKEVDNVPLLVSLFTDATKDSTAEMMEIFQEFNDTVIAMGMSHLSRNVDIFETADLSIGIDVLEESLPSSRYAEEAVQPLELSLVTAISASNCAFRLKGASSTAKLPSIIKSGRMALQGSRNGVMFAMAGCISFSLYCCFTLFAASTTLPFTPIVGSLLFLQFCVPFIALALAMQSSDPQAMKQVPPKNDPDSTFGRNERLRLYSNSFAKALLPAILPQFLFLVTFGELVAQSEPALAALCGGSDWTKLIRCKELKFYSGSARIEAGSLMFAEMTICVIVASASFCHRTKTIWEEPPWKRNTVWMAATFTSLLGVVVYLLVVLDRGTFSVLPWYVPIFMITIPCFCLMANEAVKINDQKHVKRAVTLRRLQFETRLGMWSPK